MLGMAAGGDIGGVTEWLMVQTVNMPGYALRRFESYPHHGGRSGEQDREASDRRGARV